MGKGKAKARLALLWHMHQPPYREAETGEHLLPWVRLHATRAYNDMAAVLERHPGVRCTVNFTPILLEQLEEQAEGRARDRSLRLAERPPGDLDAEERQALLKTFFMVAWERNVRPVPRYRELLEKRGRDLRRVDLARAAAAFGDAELTDLQAHFQLAWMGFAARKEHPEVAALRDKGRDYSREDVDALLAAQRRIQAGIVPRWRALAGRGQVELSTTPYHHPILPLVLDTDAAGRALPGIPLPPRFSRPDDARWHVREAIASHARRFGAPPAGTWPAEGAVSPEAVELLATEGLRWAASDEGVLLHSLPPGASRLETVYRPWRVSAGGAGELAMLFRDRALSDAIGFSYAGVPARRAAEDFLSHVAAVGEAWERAGRAGPATVGVFLDGENAWEHYPASGEEFLERLHAGLEGSFEIETATMSEATRDAPGPPVPRIHSGSWIESSFRIWIGHAEDRTAWTALGKVREAVAAAERAGADAARIEEAKGHLRAAEASDWFWWYGDDFATEQAEEFDALFRGHVVRAAQLAGVPPPAEALEPIKQPPAGEAPAREPPFLRAPVLDGRETTFFEWQGAAVHRPGQQRGSMYGAAAVFQALHFGFDLSALHVRLDPADAPERTSALADRARVVVLAAERQVAVDFPLVRDGALRPGSARGVEAGRAAFDLVLEASIPFEALGLAPGSRLALCVHVLRGELEVERLPRSGFVACTVPDADFERRNWSV